MRKTTSSAMEVFIPFTSSINMSSAVAEPVFRRYSVQFPSGLTESSAGGLYAIGVAESKIELCVVHLSVPPSAVNLAEPNQLRICRVLPL